MLLVFRLRTDLYCVEWDVKLYYTTTTILMLVYKVTETWGRICAKFSCIRNLSLRTKCSDFENRHPRGTGLQLEVAGRQFYGPHMNADITFVLDNQMCKISRTREGMFFRGFTDNASMAQGLRWHCLTVVEKNAI